MARIQLHHGQRRTAVGDDYWALYQTGLDAAIPINFTNAILRVSRERRLAALVVQLLWRL